MKVVQLKIIANLNRIDYVVIQSSVSNEFRPLVKNQSANYLKMSSKSLNTLQLYRFLPDHIH